MSEPFVTHKLIMGKEKITGDKDFTTIDAWIKELETDSEIVTPGAKHIMVDAQAVKSIIDASTRLGSPQCGSSYETQSRAVLHLHKEVGDKYQGQVRNPEFEQESRT